MSLSQHEYLICMEHTESTTESKPRDDIGTLNIPSVAKSYARRSGLASMKKQPKEFQAMNAIISNPGKKNKFRNYAAGETTDGKSLAKSQPNAIKASLNMASSGVVSKLLNEATEGVEEFMDTLVGTYPELGEHRDTIQRFIEDSGCKRINFESLISLGAALSSGVLINTSVLRGTKEQALYTIFHEAAHQYQYKKYGSKIDDLFINDSDVVEASKFLKMIENVADRYSIMKIKQLADAGILDPGKIVTKGIYSSLSLDFFVSYLRRFRKELKERGITSTQGVSKALYDYIVVNDYK